ncbi:hypothetical protein DFJ58DRAFT_837138 [Suillus subalutaceus]|uniref:uncharacterized protein n=1 Tax=Suillus subalutaceus TaxID=48586 RepID=UPI001B85E50D|nr:uncharacterized protein DFJ58DRAFT_837138 [Suillus subalutaceus]KAG1871822.1 hypothetical protein DFJ58DRAFT_837138 [Suillus subalutaceus]
MKKKQSPYPVYPAPIELCHAARFLGRESNPYVSFDAISKHAGYLENGLATLHPSTLYKGYKAKLAACETACQHLVITAWEIEESERFTAFLDALHAENEDQLGLVDKELQRFRDYLQAIYEDECEILCVTSAQAEQISKILGSRVKDAFLQSGAAESRPCSLDIPDDEDDPIILDSSEDLDSKEECPGVGAGKTSHQPHALPIVDITFSLLLMMSGLNPSHFPANTQMDLSDEQPEEPTSNAFDPHSYTHSSFVPFNYNDDTHAGPSSSAGLNPSSSANLHYSNYTDPSFSTHSGHAPFNYDDDAQSGPSSSAGLGPSSSANLHHTPFNYDDNTHAGPLSSTNYSLPNYHPDELSALDDMSGIASNPHHIQVPYSSTEAEPSLGPQHNPLPITVGEIPVSQVIHTTGPAQSSDRWRHARKLPGTPYLTRQDSDVWANIAATTEVNVTVVQATPGAPDDNRYFMVTGAVRDQIFQHAKELAMGVIFTKEAMASSTDDKNCIVKNLLRQATPKFPGLSGTPRWSNKSKDIMKIWCNIIVVRTVLMTFTRDGIVMAYDLFPPQGSQFPPEAFRVTRWDTHNSRKVQESLRCMMGLAATFTKCTLMEQGREVLSAACRLSPEANSSMFDGICSEMDDLSIEEEADLDKWIDHIVVCGVSQQHIKVELSDFNLDSYSD